MVHKESNSGARFASILDSGLRTRRAEEKYRYPKKSSSSERYDHPPDASPLATKKKGTPFSNLKR